MRKVRVLPAHSHLSYEVMEDKIWKLVADDIKAADSRKLRTVIPLVTELCRLRSSLSMKEFEDLMVEHRKYSRPTIRKHLKRVLDLGYASLRLDPQDGRIKRIHATERALKICQRIAEFRALANERVLELARDEIKQISKETRAEFERFVAYDAVAAISEIRGRRVAAK